MSMPATTIPCWPLPKRGSLSGFDRAIARAAGRRIWIPLWVPAELLSEYADCALAHGEEHAASYIRKLKKELNL